MKVGLVSPYVHTEWQLEDPDGLRLRVLPGERPGLHDVVAIGNPLLYAGLIDEDAPISFAPPSDETALIGAGITHHIALTIVGADAAPDGYYAGKLSQERLIEAGEVPWTILRATQFHEYAALMFATVKAGPLHAAPRARVQPIAVREVAEHLVGLAEAGPGGRVTELAGPREESLSRMVSAYARAIGHRGPLPEISLPGAFGRAQRNGSLLPKPGATLGVQTFDEWLEAFPDR